MIRTNHGASNSITRFSNPVWESLTGPHRHLARTVGRARRYPPEVAPFLALPDDVEDGDWDDAAELLGQDATFITRADLVVPHGWTTLEWLTGTVMTAAQSVGKASTLVRELNTRDIPAMLDLAERTHPGPFTPGVLSLGSFVGIEEHGALVAMGGTRLRGEGWTEVSSICTAPESRGKGYGSTVVRHLAATIQQEGRVPMLHVLDGNHAAELYAHLGFAAVLRTLAAVVRPPTS